MRAPALESWYPEWSKQLARTYAGGTRQLFLLHGNVSDLVRVEKKDTASYTMLPEFLATQIFGTWDCVIYYDQVRGPRALANTPGRLSAINNHLERYIGSVEQLKETNQPGRVFQVLDRYLERILLTEGERKSVAIILDYAHFIAPASSVSNTSRELSSTLATLLNWAKSPYFKRAPFAFCLISERLSDLHDSLTRNAHIKSIEVQFPRRGERSELVSWVAGERDFDEVSEVAQDHLADLTAGITLVHLQGLLERAIRTDEKLTLDDLKKYKKETIEAECQGLVEFVEPPLDLEMVVGQAVAKRRLLEDAELLVKGRLDAVPMGYLLCGPVGTGKTFMAECYAGSVGIPCVKLKNFRSKYVGETEGNLEKILKVLRVMGPVAVIIDEADTMLGDRGGSSDSGTTSRVFGQFAAQMGNTAYRGKIIWFLLTCRPDLLPIDIKRQGRCEVHIPLFYPQTDEDFKKMFVVMGEKNSIDIEADEVPAMPEGLSLSGADIESITNQAKRLAILAGEPGVSREHLDNALGSFVPSAEGEEKELQTLAAILESTDLQYLPDEAKRLVVTKEGRNELSRRYRALRVAVGQ